jgi:hypothetical protein
MQYKFPHSLHTTGSAEIRSLPVFILLIRFMHASKLGSGRGVSGIDVVWQYAFELVWTTKSTELTRSN